VCFPFSEKAESTFAFAFEDIRKKIKLFTQRRRNLFSSLAHIHFNQGQTRPSSSLEALKVKRHFYLQWSLCSHVVMGKITLNRPTF
jgi:hypothetical protein